VQYSLVVLDFDGNNGPLVSAAVTPTFQALGPHRRLSITIVLDQRATRHRIKFESDKQVQTSLFLGVEFLILKRHNGAKAL
jgi:hypothetical protein